MLQPINSRLACSKKVYISVNPCGIFSIRNKNDFEKKAIEIFRLQAEKNTVYKKYIEHLNLNPEKTKTISQIPFLPVEFFKTHKITTRIRNSEFGIKNVFLSSGTSEMKRSKHYVTDISIYKKSFLQCFESFYGDVKQYTILAILPSYYENKNSSLIFMVRELIARSKNKHSGFFFNEDKNLLETLKILLHKKQKVILFGVTFALMYVSSFMAGASDTLIVIETGGMKGRREEITREELHKILCKKFGVKKIHSEYGMTELLSQAYSKGGGRFRCPPWMKIFVRDANDPLSLLSYEKTGAINIIDLANIYSCSFIATQDAGMVYADGSFEVTGRMDNSDLRGCNLLV